MGNRLPRPAAALNQSCFCKTVDLASLRQALEHEIGDADLTRSISETHPHLFANVSVFISADAAQRMRDVAGAIDSLTANPAYQKAVLAWAPEIAQYDPGPIGALMGYDFHLEAGAPQLIEVNTNAGGAFLNALLTRAQIACCPEVRRPGAEAAADFEASIEAMFRAEWKRQRGNLPLARIAIVDDSPAGQYLYPEFLLVQRMLARAGLESLILDPKELSYKDGRLIAADKPIDLVYNRLTDFALTHPDHAALRSAYLDGAVVLTPNPRAHALLAHKRNLTLLSDPTALGSLGVEDRLVKLLQASVPRTTCVTPENAAELWADRRRLFFKPMAGFGSKGAYRGDKVTKSVWESIITGGYVAQSFAPPGQRTIKLDGSPVSLKADIRLYTYAGKQLLSAARLYQGQTTNLRTQGGGFAPIFQAER
ncbi:MAG: hypothetical protein AB7H70_09685 [Rhodospirillaceae bacterium]